MKTYTYRAFQASDLSPDDYNRLWELVLPEGGMRQVLTGRAGPVVRPVAAWCDGAIVGWSCMYEDASGAGYDIESGVLLGTFVDPAHRGHGVAAQLMKAELELYRRTNPDDPVVYYDGSAPAAAAIARAIRTAGFTPRNMFSEENRARALASPKRRPNFRP